MIKTNVANKFFEHLRKLYPFNAILLDISRHQGNIDFQVAKSRGVVGVYTRVTIADYYTDDWVDVYADNIKKVGLPRGDYHVTRADIKPNRQMDRYYRDRPSGDTPPPLGIVLDNEISGRNVTIKINRKKTKIEYKKFTRNQVVDNVLACKEIIQSRDGIMPMNYTFPYFYWDYMHKSPGIKEMPLWLAHFKTDVPGNLGRKNIFDMLKIDRSDMFMWQALADSDDQGPYFHSGAHGLDVNFFMDGDGTEKAFNEFFDLKEEENAPQPVPVDCDEVYNIGYIQGQDDTQDKIVDFIDNM